MTRRISCCVATALGPGDQYVRSQSPSTVYADQVLDQGILDPKLLPVLANENFRKKMPSVVPSSTSYLEAWTKHCTIEECELGMIYRVKRMGLLRIIRDKLTLTSHYPVF